MDKLMWKIEFEKTSPKRYSGGGDCEFRHEPTSNRKGKVQFDFLTQDCDGSSDLTIYKPAVKFQGMTKKSNLKGPSTSSEE